MSNIKFTYFYRDSSNYKNYSFVIFNNPQNFGLVELEKLIRSKLIDETWFYAREWKLLNLYFSDIDIENDPTWHEFESVEYTDEAANINFELAEFLNLIA